MASQISSFYTRTGPRRQIGPPPLEVGGELYKSVEYPPGANVPVCITGPVHLHRQLQHRLVDESNLGPGVRLQH
jgi:hypothetical protein